MAQQRGLCFTAPGLTSAYLTWSPSSWRPASSPHLFIDATSHSCIPTWTHECLFYTCGCNLTLRYLSCCSDWSSSHHTSIPGSCGVPAFLGGFPQQALFADQTWCPRLILYNTFPTQVPRPGITLSLRGLELETTIQAPACLLALLPDLGPQLRALLCAAACIYRVRDEPALTSLTLTHSHMGHSSTAPAYLQPPTPALRDWEAGF